MKSSLILKYVLLARNNTFYNNDNNKKMLVNFLVDLHGVSPTLWQMFDSCCFVFDTAVINAFFYLIVQ